MEGIHQAIVLIVHCFIHPDGIRHVNIHRHSQLAASLKQGVHASIVRVHAKCTDSARNKSFSLVMKFTNTPGACLMALFQSPYCLRTESGLVIPRVIKTAPEFETFGMGGRLPTDIVKSVPRSASMNDGLLNSDLVHISDPLVTFSL